MKSLIEAAAKVRANAYAPYSVYKVGAAVLGADGNVYIGCNVENVSYGLTVCAERNAIGRMVTDGCTEVKAVAVVTSDGGTPCGMCRQALLEFAKRPEDVEVWSVSDTGAETVYRLSELIPKGFSSELKKE